jgi:DNA-binding beta-propeller fold protein YncE
MMRNHVRLSSPTADVIHRSRRAVGRVMWNYVPRRKSSAADGRHLMEEDHHERGNGSRTPHPGDLGECAGPGHQPSGSTVWLRDGPAVETLLVVDTPTNDIVTKVKPPEMIRPAGGRFHPSLTRYYAGGTGKVTTNRPVNAHGHLLRFHGETHTVITTPTAKLETMSTTGDEPNEFSFSKEGLLADVGHHGAMFTGSPTDQMDVAIVDAATFTVKKRIPMMASATVPGYVDIDPDSGRVYVTTKWSPTVVMFDGKAERVLRYIDLGGFGPGYGVALTPDKQRLYIPLGAPALSAVAVVDAKTLTVVANIVDTDLIGPRLARFPNY